MKKHKHMQHSTQGNQSISHRLKLPKQTVGEWDLILAKVYRSYNTTTQHRVDQTTCLALPKVSRTKRHTIFKQKTMQEALAQQNWENTKVLLLESLYSPIGNFSLQDQVH